MTLVPPVDGMSYSVPAFLSIQVISRQTLDSGFGGSLFHEGTSIRTRKGSAPLARPQESRGGGMGGMGDMDF